MNCVLYGLKCCMLEEFNILVYKCMFYRFKKKRRSNPLQVVFLIRCLICLIFEVYFLVKAGVLFWLGASRFIQFVCCICYTLNTETGGEPGGNPHTCQEHHTNFTQTQLQSGDPGAVRQQCYLLHHHDTLMIAYHCICHYK